MPRFRKKPVVIEAVAVADMLDNADARPVWFAEAVERGDVLFVSNPDGVSIATLEGAMLGDRDDWIIQGIRGELYPCKPDIFAATYEAVE